jgi:hypothetical protein
MGDDPREVLHVRHVEALDALPAAAPSFRLWRRFLDGLEPERAEPGLGLADEPIAFGRADQLEAKGLARARDVFEGLDDPRIGV